MDDITPETSQSLNPLFFSWPGTRCCHLRASALPSARSTLIEKLGIDVALRLLRVCAAVVPPHKIQRLHASLPLLKTLLFFLLEKLLRVVTRFPGKWPELGQSSKLGPVTDAALAQILVTPVLFSR